MVQAPAQVIVTLPFWRQTTIWWSDFTAKARIVGLPSSVSARLSFGGRSWARGSRLEPLCSRCRHILWQPHRRTFKLLSPTIAGTMSGSSPVAVSLIRDPILPVVYPELPHPPSRNGRCNCAYQWSARAHIITIIVSDLYTRPHFRVDSSQTRLPLFSFGDSARPAASIAPMDHRRASDVPGFKFKLHVRAKRNSAFYATHK